eukprot:2598507-Heterocapsa_arctica.AAC.1
MTTLALTKGWRPDGYSWNEKPGRNPGSRKNKPWITNGTSRSACDATWRRSITNRCGYSNRSTTSI